jgi:hypothetical protein
MVPIAFWMMLAAVAASGLLAGASLDQLVKQLPARNRIGIEAYSRYSQASDLGNGILFYGILGVGQAVLAIAAAVAVHLAGLPSAVTFPADAGAGFAVFHTLATVVAAPTLFSQRRVQSDLAALTQVFDRFQRVQTVRAALQVADFGVLLWSLIEIVGKTRAV